MTLLDWILALGLNAAVILHALIRPARINTTRDWFLASRSLPWWIVGLSAYATAIDSSDLVADSGGVYDLGMAYFATNWVGTVAGWLLLGHLVIRPMLRLGMYTNAEYLEARFGPTASVISVFVQLAYRTVVMGIMATTIYLTMSIVAGLGAGAWWVVGGFVAAATAYTIRGGSGSVSRADAIQSAVMMGAAVALFVSVWSAVGGYEALETQLNEKDPALARRMLHIGVDEVQTIDAGSMAGEEIARREALGGVFDANTCKIERRTPAWLLIVKFLIVGLAYSIVNHEQTMRLFAARNLWHLQMGVALAALLLIVATGLNLGMGILGRGLFPDETQLPVGDIDLVKKTDAIYPVLIRDYAGDGFRGLIVAGLLAAALSTYTGTGSALSALLTRDVYGRLLVKDREDSHYLAVGRWLTLVVIAGSFAYVPFLLRRGMLLFYLDMVGAFVVPLLTIYLVGSCTRVSRKSGAVGLAAGAAYGAFRLVAQPLAETSGVFLLPPVLLDGSVAFPASMGVTATAMFLVTLVYGSEPKGALVHEETTGWLRESQRAARSAAETEAPAGWRWLPLAFGLAVLALGLWLTFGLFW